MHFVNLESADPRILEVLGKCEVCGEQACSIVVDQMMYVYLDHKDPEPIAQRNHRFCEKHDREPRFRETFEGPMMYSARLGI